MIHQYQKIILSKKKKTQTPITTSPLTCCITAPQETVVLKGRINWSFNFSLFIVRGKITEVLPWGEQQLKVRPGSFNPRGKKVGNLLNSLFRAGGIQHDNLLYCYIKEDSSWYLLNTGKFKLPINTYAEFGCFEFYKFNERNSVLWQPWNHYCTLKLRNVSRCAIK